MKIIWWGVQLAKYQPRGTHAATQRNYSCIIAEIVGVIFIVGVILFASGDEGVVGGKDTGALGGGAGIVVSRRHCDVIAVIASAAKQSRAAVVSHWIASLRSQ